MEKDTNTKTKRIINRKAYLKNHPYPNLYSDESKKSFCFKLQEDGKKLRLFFPYSQIKTSGDFENMISTWEAYKKKNKVGKAYWEDLYMQDILQMESWCEKNLEP